MRDEKNMNIEIITNSLLEGQNSPHTLVEYEEIAEKLWNQPKE